MSSVLVPYHDEERLRKRRGLRYGLFATLVLFCFLYGFAFALVAPFLMIYFAVPLVVVAGFIIWALPDTQNPPLKTLTFLFFGYMAADLAWPQYLAIALPGLPWITVTRLFLIPMTITLLVNLSVSQSFRTKLKSILWAAPVLTTALGMFVLVQVFSVMVSDKPFYSMNVFVSDQMAWTGMFLVSCYLFAEPGRAERWAKLMWGFALYLIALGLIESRLGRVPWAGHIPSFLKMDGDLVDAVTSGVVRLGTGAHRVSTIFASPLCFSEFQALVAPIVLHFALTGRQLWVRAAAFATVPLLGLMAIVSQSRSGLLGVGISCLLYLLAWAVLRWRRQGGLIATAIVVGYPVLFGTVLAASLFIGRIRKKVWGGGEHASSNNARVEQYHSGIPKILARPIGYGLARGGEKLGYMAPNGSLTIDTFYLEVALDYGIIGFLIYYTLMCSGFIYPAKYLLKTDPKIREHGLLISAGLMLTNFVVLNSVFAEQQNHTLIFITLGLIVAMVYRIRRESSVSGEPGNDAGVQRSAIASWSKLKA